MDFDFSPDQLLLQESIQKLLANHYDDLSKRRAYAAAPHGFLPEIWAEYAEAGILGLPFAEEHGGFGGGPVETMIVMEAFGKALALEPFLTNTVLCGDILKHSSHANLLPEVANGTKILALAAQERSSRHVLHHVTLTARREGQNYILEGEKSLVIGGGAAHMFIVSARTSGAVDSQQGLTLFLVDAATPGLSRRTYPTQDGTQAAEISFAQVRVSAKNIIGEPDHGFLVLKAGVDTAIAGLCAEAVGVMDALVKLTVDYMKTRKQFGTAISNFQALQHRAVDMYVHLEQARSMAIYAALMASDPDAVARHRAIAGAKIQIGRAARFIGQQATQLHGGIGMTMEYKSGHYFKRLTMIEQAFGDADHHLRSLAAA
jgi:pimeloyl-CoA dehydrogenase small subunit